MKRTQYQNLVLVSQDDLLNDSYYRIESIKERLYDVTVGYDTSALITYASPGIVKEPVDLRFVGTEGASIVSSQFTVGTGAAYTILDQTSVGSNKEYNGGERIYLPSSQTTVIQHNAGGDAANYIFLAYVELTKNKKFDINGSPDFVDRQDSYVVLQMTQAQATAFGSDTLNPTNTVTLSNVAAAQLDPLLTSDEKNATFGSWSYINSIFTITSFAATHYNTVFIGKVTCTNFAPLTYQFIHTLPGSDPLFGILARPAFSVVDINHRNKIGRGTPSTTNPHGMLIQDLGNYEANNIDHRNLDHLNGLILRDSSSLEGLITSIPFGYNDISVTQIQNNNYLFLNGKRITSINGVSSNSPPTVSFSDLPTSGTYYVYVQDSSSKTVVNSYPYEFYTGQLVRNTNIPTNSYPICSVWWDSSSVTRTARAFLGDPRWQNSKVNNPVTDLRVHGSIGYDGVPKALQIPGGRENLIPNGNMEMTEHGVVKGWKIAGNEATIGAILPTSGVVCLAVPANQTAYSEVFPFNANTDHSFRFRLNTETNTATYQVSLVFYRGKDVSTDQVGTYTLVSATTSTISNWTLIESEYLSTASITFSTALTNRTFIGYAQIQVFSNAQIDIDEVILRPKIRTIDISDSMITSPKISNGAILKGHLNGNVDVSSIAALVNGGAADSLHNHASPLTFTYGIATPNTSTITLTLPGVAPFGVWVFFCFYTGQVVFNSGGDGVVLYVNPGVGNIFVDSIVQNTIPVSTPFPFNLSGFVVSGSSSGSVTVHAITLGSPTQSNMYLSFFCFKIA